MLQARGRHRKVNGILSVFAGDQAVNQTAAKAVAAAHPVQWNQSAPAKMVFQSNSLACALADIVGRYFGYKGRLQSVISRETATLASPPA